MAEQTANYQLEKPAPEEFYDVAVPNRNMDKIDAALTALADALGGIDLAILSQAITNMDNRVTKHLDENNFLKVSDVTPTTQKVGDIWFETGLGETPSTGGGDGLVLRNAILSDGAPGDTTAVWLDFDE